MSITSKKKRILTDAIRYTFSSQVTQVIGVLAAILTRNFLGPLQMGTWSILQVVLHYASFTSLGTTQGIAREIPYLLGKGDLGKAEQVKNVVSSFQLTASVVTSIAIIVFTVLFRAHLPTQLFWGLLVSAGLILLQRASGVLVSLLRAYKNFQLASRQMVLSALVNLTLIALLAYPFKIYGFFIAMLLSLLFNIGYILLRTHFRFQFTLNAEIRHLIAFGFPLMILSVLGAIFKSIDKLFIAKFLGLEQLGYYSVAIMVSTFVGQLPNAFGIIMIPHFQEKFAQRDEAQDVRGYVDKAAFTLSYVMPLVVGTAWLVLPLFVAHLLPKYILGIGAAQALVIGSFFIALALPFGIVIVTLKKHLLLLPAIGSAILVGIAFDFIALHFGYGITGVAWATTAGLFLNFLLVYFIATYFLYNKNEGMKLFFQIIWPFVFMSVLLFGIMTFLHFESHVYLQTVAHILIFLILTWPFVRTMNREYDLLKLIREKIGMRDDGGKRDG